MSKITIEYDEDELKVMVASVLAGKLFTLLPLHIKDEITRKAKNQAQQTLADRIVKELEQA